jgi:hypothetical protein
MAAIQKKVKINMGNPPLYNRLAGTDTGRTRKNPNE